MKNTKRHYIYLSGSISSNIETFNWRTEFEQEIDKRKLDIVVINPCRSKFDQTMFKKMKAGQINFNEEHKKIPAGVLKRKDRQQVRISSLIVVNLAVHDPNRPMVGTIYELAWADELRLPVIAIIGEQQNDIYANHPFILDSVSQTAKSVQEAINIIEDFFIDQNDDTP
jgi:nucleoside 2-deoxyribosyltransferase